MADPVDNVIIEHLRMLRSEVQTLRQEMHVEFKDVKHRLASVERIQQIEKRLELI